LNRNWDTVRAAVISVVCTIVDNGGKKESNGNCKLVTANNNTTNPFGGSLGLVEGNWLKMSA